MSIEKYEKDLSINLYKILRKYEKRIQKNDGPEHKNISLEKGLTTVGGCATIGGSIGTAVMPGIGTAIGAGIGLTVGAGCYGGIKMYYKHENKKIDNAAKVLNFFGENDKNRKDIIEKASHEIIKERKDILINLSNSANNEKIAPYLASSMMSAVKHNYNKDLSDKAKIICEGIQDNQTKKISNAHLKTNDDEKISLKEIAKFTLK